MECVLAERMAEADSAENTMGAGHVGYLPLLTAVSGLGFGRPNRSKNPYPSSWPARRRVKLYELGSLRAQNPSFDGGFMNEMTDLPQDFVQRLKKSGYSARGSRPFSFVRLGCTATVPFQELSNPNCHEPGDSLFVISSRGQRCNCRLLD